jgi:hypothetical protein
VQFLILRQQLIRFSSIHLYSSSAQACPAGRAIHYRICYFLQEHSVNQTIDARAWELRLLFGRLVLFVKYCERREHRDESSDEFDEDFRTTMNRVTAEKTMSISASFKFSILIHVDPDVVFS